jgi:hypothetical protein
MTNPENFINHRKAINDESIFQTWAALDHYPANEEVVRNLPIRHPLIWIEKDR